MRQRLGILPTIAKTRSAQGDWLAKKYRLAKLSAPEVSECAAAHCQDADPADDVRRLAKSNATKERKSKHRARLDTRNCSRSILRAFRKDALLGPLYITPVPMWDEKRARKKHTPCALLPIHETLEAIIEPGNEEHYTTFQPDQSGFRNDLLQWSQALQVLLDPSLWLCLALWGDRAPPQRT